MEFTTVNPTTGELIQEYEYLTDNLIEEQIREGVTHYQVYRKRTQQERSFFLLRISKALRTFKNQLAMQMVLEMGKPLKEAIAEIEKSSLAFEYYAGSVGELLQEQIIKNSNYHKTKIIYKPMGPILAIMPWNYPIWQVTRVLAPNLALGNIIFLKHSDLVAGTAQLLSEVIESAGTQGGERALWNFTIDHKQTSRLIGDFRVRGVTFTGSTRGGSQVGETAGRFLKKSVLELGGSDPYIILKDANLNMAAEKCAISRLLNNGQSCISAKRFLVDHKVYEQFIDKFCAAISKFRIGDPQSLTTDLGPLANLRFKQEMVDNVKALELSGYQKVLEGGPIPDIAGAYFKPAVLVQVKPLYHQIQLSEVPLDRELFGPVARVEVFSSEEEMLRLVNSSQFGLGASLFTEDIERAYSLMAEEIECGMVVLNDYLRSDARVPFGGIKNSGYGRELGGLGIQEFANIKVLSES